MLMQTPKTFKRLDIENKWSLLANLWEDSTVTFNLEEDGWRIRENLCQEIFSMRRDFITNNRYTDKDTFGLLGLSLIDLSSKECFITEGVSDFFTAKMLLDANVLGVTQLGGSFFAKQILISLFDNIVILSDADPTGTANALRWKFLLQDYGISVKVWTPSIGKDITDEFLFNYKLNEPIQF